jgi:hypothetical protein
MMSAFDFADGPRPAEIVPFTRGAPQRDQGPPRVVFFLAYGVGMLLGAGAIALAAITDRRRTLAPVRPISEAGGGP